MLAIALSRYEATLCDGCRNLRTHSEQEATKSQWHTKPRVCYACADLEKSAKKGKSQSRARSYVVMPKPGLQAQLDRPKLPQPPRYTNVGASGLIYTETPEPALAGHL